MPKTKKRQRRPSHPKGEHTPNAYCRKKKFRAECKAKAADGRVNDAHTGLWHVPSNSVSSKSVAFGMGGSRLRGGSTKGGPRPHYDVYAKKQSQEVDDE